MTGPGRDEPSHRPDGAERRSLRAALFAFYVDQFDIYLPVLVLASVGTYFLPVGVSPASAAVLSGMVFAATLVARPIGAALFGDLADRRGRKHTTVLATAGFGCVTLLMAMLPGSAAIGGWSVGLLIALRFVNGIFLGGAYTAAVPMAMEWSAPERRGLVAGRILSASPAAYATLGLLTLVLQQSMPADSYAALGWRIPFVIGALMALAVVITYGRTASEPDTPRTGVGQRRPLVDLFSGPHRRDLLQVLVLMTGIWLANNMVSAVLPAMMGSRLQLPPTAVAAVATVNSVGLVIAFQLYGALSQRIGRRRFYIGYGVVMALAGGTLYALLMTLRPAEPAVVMAFAVAIGFATNAGFGPVAAYLTERFPARVRASGFGVGYSLALVLPAFYSFYLAGLGAVVPDHLAPVVLIVIAGLLVSLGGVLGPETKDADLRR